MKILSNKELKIDNLSDLVVSNQPLKQNPVKLDKNLVISEVQ